MIREVTDPDLISGSLGLYDWLMVLFLLAAIVAGFAIVLWILGLPGKIALSRNHPHAETVKIMGWAGALPVFPWIHAFIWAFHDSVTVDIRRFPREEREAIEREIAHLKGEDAPAATRVEAQRVPATPPSAQS
jgi:hypothetical protein